MTTVETLSPEKRAQILRGAATIFAQDGYEGASMSRIANEAGVSKGTLYNYFESKADMFSAWVAGECANKLAHLFEGLDFEGDLAVALHGIGVRMVEMMLSGAGETIYRMVVSEAGQFPELARTFFEQGPKKATASLSAKLAVENDRGRLRIADTDFAAEQFFALCQTRIVMRCKLHIRQDVTPAEIHYVVGESVTMFLARYRA